MSGPTHPEAPLPPPDGAWQRPWSDPGLWAVSVAVCVALGAVWPAPGERMVGHPVGEGTTHIWVQWLIGEWWAGNTPLFGQAGVVAHELLWLMPTDLTTRLVALVLEPCLGPVATLNVTVGALLLLAGGSTVAIARELGAGPWAGALAGVWMVWAPSLLGFAADGRVDSLGVGWVGLAVWALLRVLRRPGRRTGAVLGLAAIGVLGAGPNQAMALALVGTVPVVLVWVTRRSVRPALWVGAAIAAPVALVLLWLIVQVEGNDPGRLHPESAQMTRAPVARYDAELPGSAHHIQLWDAALQANRGDWVGAWHELPRSLTDHPSMVPAAAELRTQVVAPGAVWSWTVLPWGLALAGLFRRKRVVVASLAGAMSCQLLALGLGPAHAMPLAAMGELWVVAPGALLQQVPGLQVFNNFGLFAPMASMAVSVAAACAVRWRWAGALVVGVLWAGEVQAGPVPLPLRATDMTLSTDARRALHAVDPRRAVVTLPGSFSADRWLQAVSGHPTVLRFRFGVADASGDGQLAVGFKPVRDLRAVGLGERPTDPGLAHRLARAGVGAVVLVPGLLPPDQRAAFCDAMVATLGSPRVGSDGVWVFVLPELEGDVWWPGDLARGTTTTARR